MDTGYSSQDRADPDSTSAPTPLPAHFDTGPFCEAIPAHERPAWERVCQGLTVEIAGLGFVLLGAAGVWIVWTIAAVNGSIPKLSVSGPAFLSALEPCALVWMVLTLLGRCFSLVSPPMLSRLAVIGSAAMFVVVVLGLPLASSLVEPHHFLRQRAAIILIALAGLVFIELLFVLHLRALALRFGSTRLAQQFVLLFAATVVLVSMLYGIWIGVEKSQPLPELAAVLTVFDRLGGWLVVVGLLVWRGWLFARLLGRITGALARHAEPGDS